MSSMSFADKIQGNVSKANFRRSPPPGKHWKSKSMRIIPEEFVISTQGAFEHRVVCSVRWGNSWQFWLEREKKGLVIDEEDWDEFVDRNFLGPNDVLVFTHEDSMFLQLQIYKNNGKEIISAPVKPELEPETEPVHPTPQNSHQETTTASGLTASASASGGTYRQATEDFSNVKNPKRYLLNPKSPYFVKTLTKKNDVLYVPKPVILEYGLKFGPMKSPMTWILPEGKMEGLTKIYGRPCFNGWTDICRRYNLNEGDSVVCELELSGGVVAAVRVHFPKEVNR